MRIGYLAALVCLINLVAPHVSAATEPVPILLRFPSSAELNSPEDSGLIGMWSFASLNRQQVAKIARFNAWLPEAALESKARAALTCAPIGAPEEGCRTEAQFPRSEEEFHERLRSGPVQRGFIVTFQPIMVPAGLSLRVPIKEVEWDGKEFKALRTLTVMYCTRVPRSLETQPNVTEEQLQQFWMSGTPSRLSVEVDKGVREAASLAVTLAANIRADGSIPKEWRDLPKLGPLEKAGRTRCRGMPCSGVRVYRDTPDGLWLTFASNAWTAGRLPPDVGAALVSVDADAASFETSVWGLTFAGY